MKIKRKVLFFLALMSLIYCLNLMQETYAKYVSSASANTSLTIARWNILINNQDIIQDSNFTATISPVFSGTENIKSNVIAPTSEGYFDITLDGSDTDVSFTYTIELNQSHLNTVDDLMITKYLINGVEYSYNSNIISEDVLLNAIEKRKSIRFFVKWNDDVETQTMDNEQDTISAHNGVAAFDIDVNIIQKR